jgi:hypothetical protein
MLTMCDVLWGFVVSAGVGAAAGLLAIVGARVGPVEVRVFYSRFGQLLLAASAVLAATGAISWPLACG